jgi:hypothetical protein
MEQRESPGGCQPTLSATESFERLRLLIPALLFYRILNCCLRRLQEFIEPIFDDCVALARCLLEARTIENLNRPAVVADEAGRQAINKWPSTTLCCPDAAALASDLGLATALADPYAAPAHNVLSKHRADIAAVCIKSGGVGDALNVNGNWNRPGLSSLTLAQITSEIRARRPIAAGIKWHSGAQHVVAIAGIQDDMLLICDPVNGETAIQYESFPSAYHGGASLVSACLTKKK